MKFAELSEVDLKVIKGIHNVVAERGADWRYPNGFVDGQMDSFISEDWVPSEWATNRGTCYNLLKDGSGACIIGSLAVDQGLPTRRSSSAGDDGRRWLVSDVVMMAMAKAQSRQDKGYVWGEALDDFNTYLSAAVEDYALELPQFLHPAGGTK